MVMTKGSENFEVKVHLQYNHSLTRTKQGSFKKITEFLNIE